MPHSPPLTPSPPTTNLSGLNNARTALSSQPPDDRYVLLLADQDDLAAAQAAGIPAVSVPLDPKGIQYRERQAIRQLECDVVVVYPHTRGGYAWGLEAAVELATNGVDVSLLEWPASSEHGFSLTTLWSELKDKDGLARAITSAGRLETTELPLRPTEGFFHPRIEGAKPLRYPKGFALGLYGTYQVDSKDGKRWLKRIATRPLWLDELMEDLDSQEYAARLCTTEAQPMRVPRGVLLDGSKIKELADHGFPVSSIGTGPVIRYIEGLEEVNRGAIPAMRTVSRMGWRDGAFSWGTTVLSKDNDQNVVPAPSAGIDDSWFTRHHSAGEPEEWAKILPELVQYHVPTVLMLASMSSVLLSRLGVQSAVYETVGESASGKTSAQSIAQSVWGYGHESALPSWNTTAVGLEVMLGAHRNLPLVLNENQSFGRGPRAAEEQARVAYMIGEGVGRARSNKAIGLNEIKRWTLNVVASGEHSMTSATSFSGIVARVFPLWSPPFGERSKQCGQMVDRLKAIVSEHYGHAGPMMVRKLLELDDEGWEKLRTHHREAQVRLVEKAQGTPQQKYSVRMAQNWGALWVAASILERLFPNAVPEGAYHDAILTGWHELMTRGDERSYSERALDVARELMATRHEEFDTGHNKPENPAGRIVKGNKEGDFVAFFPGVLADALRSGGMDLETAEGHWVNEDIVLTTGRGRKVVKVAGKTVRCVAIRLSALELEDGEEEEGVDSDAGFEDETFPF